MDQPNLTAKLPKRARSLRPAGDWALFLDVDGTILHFADTPDGVAPSERVAGLLQEVSRCLEGAVALVSGRSIDNLDHLFGPHVTCLAGLHGLERRDAEGRLHLLGEAEALEHLRAPLAELAEGGDGVLLEDKQRALAVHYRQAPHKADEIRRRVEELVRPSVRDLRIIHGKMVSEIKPRHADKGSAIQAFMDEAPFAGRLPVFIGDDVTDEDGFVAVNALKGLSIHVGDGAATAARYQIAGVDQVIDWLETWPSAIRRRSGASRP